MKFKCPTSYCIPYGYACDGKRDCPFANDEHECNQRRDCLGLFSCSNSTTCLHMKDICDGFNDCPSHEDELLCELMHCSCPEHCYCLNYAMVCKEACLNFNHSTVFPHVYVSVFSSQASFSLALAKMPHLMHLVFSNNNLTVLHFTKSRQYELRFLDCSYNLVPTLRGECCEAFGQLQYLNLHQNQISDVDQRAFSSLKKLVF